MSITTVNLVVARVDRSGKTPFAVFFTSADLQGCEVIKAAGTGRIYLESLKVWTNVALNWTVGEGETTSAVTAALIGPVDGLRDIGTPASIVAMPVSFDYKFKDKHAIQLTNLLDLTIDASAAGIVCGIAEGYTTA